MITSGYLNVQIVENELYGRKHETGIFNSFVSFPEDSLNE
jgi:hypothetical protein